MQQCGFFTMGFLFCLIRNGKHHYHLPLPFIPFWQCLPFLNLTNFRPSPSDGRTKQEKGTKEHWKPKLHGSVTICKFLFLQPSFNRLFPFFLLLLFFGGEDPLSLSLSSLNECWTTEQRKNPSKMTNRKTHLPLFAQMQPPDTRL